MPVDLATMTSDVLGIIDGVIPLASVGMMAFFGFAVGAGAFAVRRFSRSLR